MEQEAKEEYRERGIQSIFKRKEMLVYKIKNQNYRKFIETRQKLTGETEKF